MDKLGLGPIPMVSLAKREEEVFLPGRAESLRLSRRSPSLRLLQRARDEAHRFGLAYNRQRRTTRTITSELLNIPGVGPNRRRQLLERFGSLAGVRSASVVRARDRARLFDPPRRAHPLAPEWSQVTAAPALSLADWTLECSSCDARRGPEGLPTVCDRCGMPWLVRYPARVPTLVDRAELRRRHGMWRFRTFLPLMPGEEPVTLGEGDTPLLRLERTGRRLGVNDLWVKDEGANPTGSFKSRGLGAAVTRAVAAGAERFVLPTAGNAGVAAAAYGARAGRPVRVYAPLTTPRTILSQIRAFGADLVLLDGHIGDCGTRVAGLRRGDRRVRSLHPAGAVSNRGQEDARARARDAARLDASRRRSSTPPAEARGSSACGRRSRSSAMRAGSRERCPGCTPCRAPAARRWSARSPTVRRNARRGTIRGPSPAASGSRRRSAGG